MARAQLVALTETLSLRGPDASRFAIQNTPSASFGFGHRRLTLIGDSTHGGQPAALEGRWWLTYNGAIYNFVELARDLGWPSEEIAKCSDTEVLLHLLAKHGGASLDQLDGMWAFALWDAHEETLTLSRDRFGEKPLFYSQLQDGWAFASELQAFRMHPQCPPTLNEEVAMDLLIGEEPEPGATLLRGVRELPAGSIAVLRKSSIDCQLWWNTLDHLPTVPRKYDDRVDEFRSLIIDSIATRMRADVPIACSLSGGFDSSVIAAVMGSTDHADNARRAACSSAFVASSPWSFVDETAAARRAASFSHLPLIEVLSPQDVSVPTVTHALDAMDGVFCAPTVVAHLLYAQMRERGIYCSLEGHGLDELIGGYLQLDRSLLADAPSLFTHPLTNAARFAAVHSFHRQFPSHARAGALVATMRSFALHHPSLRLVKQQLLSKRAQEAGHLESRLRALDAGLGDFGAELYVQFHRSILPQLLKNVDRTSMNHGIEVRSPFLAWKLVAYATALPDSDRFAHGFSKRIARDAMQGRMDESIRTNRVKLGYYTPLREWLIGPLRGWVDQLLNTRPGSTFESVAHREASARWTRFQGRHSYSNASALWTAISLLRYSNQVRGWARDWQGLAI